MQLHRTPTQHGIQPVFSLAITQWHRSLVTVAPDANKKLMHLTRPFVFRAWLVAALLPALLALPLHGAARSERDHDRARAALQAGDIMPLPMLMARLDKTHPGQVLAVELEYEAGRWRYEIKILQSGGGLLKLEVDAQSGLVLEQKQKGPNARSGR